MVPETFLLAFVKLFRINVLLFCEDEDIALREADNFMFGHLENVSILPQCRDG